MLFQQTLAAFLLRLTRTDWDMKRVTDHTHTHTHTHTQSHHVFSLNMFCLFLWMWLCEGVGVYVQMCVKPSSTDKTSKRLEKQNTLRHTHTHSLDHGSSHTVCDICSGHMSRNLKRNRRLSVRRTNQINSGSNKLNLNYMIEYHTHTHTHTYRYANVRTLNT